MKLVLFLFFAGSLFAESKTETELRLRLAASERANGVLVNSLAKLNADAKERGTAQTAALKQVDSTTKQAAQTATKRNEAATQERADATSDAQIAVQNAEVANQKAVLAAVAAKTQADELMKVSDHNNFATYTTLIVSVFGFLTLLTQLAWKSYTDSRDHRWLVDATNAATLATSAAALATAAHREKELAKIAEVKTSAQAAFEEANTVNKKIESIGVKMNDDRPLVPKEGV